MTRADLIQLGMPEEFADTALKVWLRELATKSATVAAAMIQAATDAMPAQEAKRVGTAVAGMALLRPEDCARLAVCTRRTVDRAIASGALKASKGLTGIVVVARSDFDAWSQARRPLSAMSKNVEGAPVARKTRPVTLRLSGEF